ncbi:MAG: hypothetical protein CMD23_00125 [Flavobacteriales bacterium]|nr:hypothetical protein [Flavobacteriales bacterium]
MKLIVAASENNVIGVQNDLPWHLPDDMNYFKETTINSVVIMGRNNYLSIPKKYRPLKDRVNIILTKKTEFHAPNCVIANSLEKAIELAKLEKKENIFIIGGGKVYKYALDKNLVDLIYLTRIHASIEGDTFFPKINLKKWKKINSKFHKKDKKHKFSFTFLIFKKVN